MEIFLVVQILDILDNLLFRSLPNCKWNLKTLIVLKLDNNNLSGAILSSVGLLYKLQLLLLRHNNFLGSLLSSLKNCTQLQVLDVEENNLEGKVPTWIGERLTNLIFLCLKANKFFGLIPSLLCHLQFVQTLDLSMNTITGPIPSCIQNFTSMVEKIEDSNSIMATIPLDEYSFGLYPVEASIMWKGVHRECSQILGLLRIIDLSSNKLIGKILESLTILIELVQLNLSRNNLRGAIPMEFGKLNKLDSLDLSHNRLSSKIPTSTQLQSFNASTYVKNPRLCGLPLTNSCPEDESQRGPHDHSGGDKSDGANGEDKFDMSSFHMGIGIGFIVEFVGVCGNLW